MDTTNLKVWLPFDRSTTTDLCGNSWTAYNNPSISDGALSLVGPAQYLSLNDDLPLGGRDFTVSGEFLMNSSTEKWARIFCVFINTETEANDIRVARNNTSDQLNVSALAVSKDCPVTMDTVHHFELDYHHDSGTVDFFLGGVKQLTLSVTIPRMNFTHCWLGRSNYSADGYFNGTLDNFMVFDGIALHSEDFTPPTAAEYAAMSAPATATFDVEVRYTNRSEVGFWRYENPGSGDYIYYHDNITTEEVDYDTSVTGVAFYGGDNNDMFNTPAGLKEVWMRFDVWLENNGIFDGGITCGHYSSAQGKIIGLTRTNYHPAEMGIPAEGERVALYLPVATRASLLLYMLSDASHGVIQATCAGNTHTYTGNVNDGADFNSLVVWANTLGNRIRISNVVVSNAPLTLEDGWHREPVAVEMNIKAPDLCVRKNGMTYTVPFATTQDPPANSVVARLGGQMVYNPLVATDNANASVIKTRYNGNNRALSASFG